MLYSIESYVDLEILIIPERVSEKFWKKETSDESPSSDRIIKNWF
jgi:hypothetical protein